MKTRHRAYAYVTHEGRLLLFTQPLAPASGIQVPAGSVRAREEPEKAALREAMEETNLKELEVASFLGQDTRDMRNCGTEELQYRWFYHIACTGDVPEKWTHGEYDETGRLLHPFDFFWVELSSLPKLVANYDDFVPQLLESENKRTRQRWR